MTKVILVVPGSTDWTNAGRVQGQLDIPLNAEGKRQIHNIIAGLANLKRIKTISALYSSPLSRSVETASEIGRMFKLKVNRASELNELNLGLWQGLLEKHIEKRYKKLYATWKSRPLSTTPPKGEGLQETYDRAVSAIQKIAARYRGKAVCVVAHEIIAAIIKCHCKKIDIARVWENLPNAASFEVLDIKR